MRRKTQSKHTIVIAMLALAGALITACSSSPEQLNQEGNEAFVKQAYEQALQKAENQNFLVELIPNVDHNIVLCETGCLDEQDNKSMEDWLNYAPAYLDLMEVWLLQLNYV